MNEMVRAEPLPWFFLSSLVSVSLLLYLLSSGPLAYGYHGDEFYYLACADRLAWGYVDHPPFSIAVLNLVRVVLGDSLLALHLLPTLSHCANLVIVGLLARELGGGRVAQRLAALSAFIFPVYLGVASSYSMNAFEPIFWSASAWLLARIINGADPRHWLALGGVLGLGLLNKISILWLGAGLAVGLLLTPQRRWLATPWPWLAGLIAGGLFAPHIFWQIQHDWPTLEFMRNAATHKMVSKSPLAFVAEQVVQNYPVFVPLWIGGLVYYGATLRGKPYRLLGWMWLTVFGLLMASGSTRASYLDPAYTVLLAAGGVVFEAVGRLQRWRWLPVAAGWSFVLFGAVYTPMSIPLIPPDRYLAYERAVGGIRAPAAEKDGLGLLANHFALRFGWHETLRAVQLAVERLSPEEREQAVILGRYFGDTGALNFLGQQHSPPLPPAISGHNNYWLWGPGDATGEIVIAIRGSEVTLRDWYSEVEHVAKVDCKYCAPHVGRASVFICRKPKHPLSEFWVSIKVFT